MPRVLSISFPAFQLKGAKLKTDVDAQVFCDLPVATPTHRFVASAIDAAVILIGIRVACRDVSVAWREFRLRQDALDRRWRRAALVTMLYGLIWAIAGGKRPGMRFTDLQLITFDGFPLDSRQPSFAVCVRMVEFLLRGPGFAVGRRR